MDIKLTQYEKKTFINFLLLYIVTVSFFILSLSIFFYKINYNISYDNAVTKLRLKASRISSWIILKHMQGYKFDEIFFNRCFIKRFNLYDKDGKILYGIDDKNINLSKTLYVKNNTIYLVDKSTIGHLGVYYIVVKDSIFLSDNEILNKTIIIFGLVFLIFVFIGYFLAKSFLQPIIYQRKQIDNFIKNSTHELNTPITALLMCANSNKIDEKLLKRIKLSAKRVSEIYSDLTYYFLVNKQNIKIETINLKEILQPQIEYFKIIAEQKNISLNCDLSDFFYKIDKESFLRLSNNLVSNSIKYTNKNGFVNIVLKNNKLIIEDNGIGIDNDKKDDIFKRFYRATDVVGGFGIGLNIVWKVCKMFNLKLDIETYKNRGTKITIFF